MLESFKVVISPHSPDLFNVFTFDFPITVDTTIATYANDTAVLTSEIDPDIASFALQNNLDLSIWATR